MSIEKIKNLVQIEKENEKRLIIAKDEAVSLTEKAEENARKIIREAEDPKSYEEIFKAKTMEITEKRNLMEQTIDEQVSQIRELTNKNMEKAISVILKALLGETG